MSKKYPELEKTLIKIEDEQQEDEEDVFPLIDTGKFEDKINNEIFIDIYKSVRERLINLIRRKFHEN